MVKKVLKICVLIANRRETLSPFGRGGTLNIGGEAGVDRGRTM